MQVLPDEVILLSDNETLNLIKEVSRKGRMGKRSQSNWATILYETQKYLEERPAALIPGPDAIRPLLIQLKQFNLTKSEKLELVNHLPTSLIELQLLVEESEERFSEDQMNEMLNIVTTFVESITPRTPEDESSQPVSGPDAQFGTESNEPIIN